MKLSFNFNASKPKISSRPNPGSSEEPSAISGSTGPQFVTEFDPTKALEPVSAVIPPIENVDYIRRYKPSLPLPSADDDPTQFCTDTQFVLDTNNSADPSGLPYGLFVRSDKESEDNANGRKTEERGDNIGLKRFKEDFQNLPDDPGQDEFMATSVEGFGAAIVRGYGWTEGMPLGRNKKKEDTKIVEYNKRGGSFGLGFTPSASDPKRKRGGDWTLPVDAAKKSEKKVPERERDRRESMGRGRREDNNNNGKVVERERDDSRRRNERVTEREMTSSKSKERESSNKRESSRNEKKEVVRWLRSHIRVRIISRDLKRGKYYLKKGEIMDVVGPTTCDISMDGTHEIVQGVEQDMLETALPKKGGAVLVLYGKNKGVFGNLMNKDLDEESAVVRDADSHELINVKLEQIAEFVGDPSYLEY